MTTTPLFKIAPTVTPYAGRLLEVDDQTYVDARSVGGWVRVGGGKGFATARRFYRWDELEDRNAEATALREEKAGE